MFYSHSYEFKKKITRVHPTYNYFNNSCLNLKFLWWSHPKWKSTLLVWVFTLNSFKFFLVILSLASLSCKCCIGSFMHPYLIWVSHSIQVSVIYFLLFQFINELLRRNTIAVASFRKAKTDININGELLYYIVKYITTWPL